MRRLALACLFVFGFSLVSQGADSLELIKDKSKIDFVGKKSDGEHKGGFKDFKVDAQANFDDPTKSSLTIEIVTDSLWSDNEGLTSHLKNPDFFDVRKYPKIKFESTKIEHANEGEATIVGMLTMLDKKVEVKVPCKVDVSDSGISMTAKFKIDRTKWGMTYGKGKVNDDVEIEATMAFKR